MADDRTALLRQAGQVQHRGRQAFQVRGHRHDGADGDDAGAAHARDEQAVGAVKRGRGRQRQLFDQALQAFLVGLGRRALPGLAAHDGHEAGAEAFRARVVLVAAGLVDGALAAIRRFQRHDRQAVRLHAAVAAAFAHRAVDQHAASGRGSARSRRGSRAVRVAARPVRGDGAPGCSAPGPRPGISRARS
ncbi:hypothetical protein G6F35_015241 [Rhizopus arrhizus]|nr:hypothetical protein G6F35_015241 [Rhizopus arrhizus]